MSTDPTDESNIMQAPPQVQQYAEGTFLVQAPALTKKIYTLQTLRRLEVRALKKAVVHFDENDPDNLDAARFCAAFVTENADYMEIPCSYGLWKRLSGYKNIKDANPATKGFEVVKADFHVWLGLAVVNTGDKLTRGKDLSNLVAVKVDTVVKHEFLHNTPPVGAKAVDTFTLTIDPLDGSINVSEYPLGYSKQDVNRLLMKLDALKVLHVGLEVSKGVTIESVVGNKVVMSVV